jgi:uncharacterized protein
MAALCRLQSLTGGTTVLSAACSRVAAWAALVLGSAGLLPILLLVGSNLFMTLAWYWHLRFKQVPLAGVIVTSWLIAFVEYCLAVPANRWGSAVYSSAQLKTIQEVITLVVFAGFSVLYLKQPMTWNYAIGFVLIATGAFFIFRGPL